VRARWLWRPVVAGLVLAAEPSAAAAGPERPAADRCGDERDERCDFEASIFFGIALDTFAASELARYLNAEESGGIRERGAVGFDFEYRISSARKGTKPRRPVWIYGGTVHGVRSADVDCSRERDLPVCALAPTDPERAAFYILRNATSFEGFVGARWEFASVGSSGSDTPARAFLSAQAGLLAVAGSGADAVDAHHVGIGVLATSGPFSGSRLEVGFGRTDLFAVHPDERWKLDGLLSWRPERLARMAGLGGRDLAWVFEVFVDADFGRGADTIQSFVGLDVGLARRGGR
jgi:hypothetical protein